MKYYINKFGNWGGIRPIPDGMLAHTLEKYLQYERQGKQFMPNPEWAKVQLYRAKTGVFPWGLLKTVERIMDKYCALHQHEFVITYNKPEIRLEKTRSDILRDYQNEAVAELIKHQGGIICLPTGAGKTITIIEYLKLMNRKSLVIVPTLDIKRQWEEYKLPLLTASTYQNPKLQDKKYLEQYDIIVCDEVHHVAAKTLYSIIMKTKTDTILVGCSATVKREDGEDMKIEAALGGIIYNKPRSELISKGWIANAKVIYLKPRFFSMIDYRFMKYQQIYEAQIVNNDARNELIVQIALKEWNNGRKVLILVSHIEHGNKLIMECVRQIQTLYKTPAVQHIKGKMPEVVFMTSKSKDRNRDMSVYDIIIATPIYDEGYDLPTLDCLILAAGGKSSIKLTQRIGRVLRIKHDGHTAIIYDFVDMPKYLNKHYLTRREILEEEFEVTDSED